mmetsp:Transcript_10430/g.42169  ORF Transcript_10430/g.42169 Transcript_10430/m.42169 type:complete len:292 (+) Transcript_10430:1098-1973(+)
MTPVTHKLLGGAAAPGQLDAATLMALRRQLFLSALRFRVVGGGALPRDAATTFWAQPATAEVLAAAHEAAFARVGLPHVVDAWSAPHPEGRRRSHHDPRLPPLTSTTETEDDAGDNNIDNAGAFGGLSLLARPARVDAASEALWDAQSAGAARVGYVDTVRLVDDGKRGRGSKTRLGDHVKSVALAAAIRRRLEASSGGGAAASSSSEEEAHDDGDGAPSSSSPPATGATESARPSLRSLTLTRCREKDGEPGPSPPASSEEPDEPLEKRPETRFLDMDLRSRCLINTAPS